MKDFLEYIDSKILVFDGAMGTALINLGLTDEEPPELWNVTNPEKVKSVHEQFFEHGAMAMTTNTFGGNRAKLSEFGYSNRVKELNKAGVLLAREAVGDKGYVVGSIGPTGGFIEPLGDILFEEAYDIFYEQAAALFEAGADAIILETMADLGEMRTALLAAKDAADIPVIASMTYSEDGRTLTGTDPETAAVVLEGLGASVISTNCSGGSRELEPVVETLCKVSNLPVLVEPNAGLPKLVDGQTIFPDTPDQMASYARRFVSLGAALVGSCCGSTPEHTAAISAAVGEEKPHKRNYSFPTRTASRTQTKSIGGDNYPVIVGERINPTGRKEFSEELKNNKLNIIKSDALKQEKEGADLLDVNVGIPAIDESKVMQSAVQVLQNTVQAPLVLDSSDPEALEAGLKNYQGKAVVNSVTAEKEVLDAVLPIVKRYGAVVVGLCIGENGIPDTPEERAAAAGKIKEYAEKYGIFPEDIIIDCLTLAVSSDQSSAKVTLESMKKVKYELGLTTLLGISNIAYGLPSRSSLNSAFLSAALSQGLDAAIINPLDRKMRDAFYSAAVIAGRDKNAQKYISYFSAETKIESSKEKQEEQNGKHPLTETVLRGDKERILPLIEKHLAEGMEAGVILNDYLIPGIEEVGEKYGRGEYFLPQLMMSADTMQEAFSCLKSELEKDTQASKGTIVLATVKGDIHDIGKNLVGIMLKNHGFKVIDLGKDVPNDDIVEAAKEHRAEVIGLSALMTTTMPRMAELVEILKEQKLTIKVIVGGAAVTNEYAEKIGANGYGRDAVEAVNLVKSFVES